MAASFYIKFKSREGGRPNYTSGINWGVTAVVVVALILAVFACVCVMVIVIQNFKKS